jgi:DNA-3-methyladenine glycosylase II
MEIASEESVRAAGQHLAGADPVLAPLVQMYGACTIRPHTDYYRELVESIIGQQLSVKAAASINYRFIELFNGTLPTPSAILEKSHDELRSAGLSGAKARYVQDLAQHVLDEKLEFSKFDTMSNENIAQELITVKGIGEWTAHMFLMFCMGRLDVLPVGDLGIRSGIKKLYGYENLPGPEEIRSLAIKNSWHPYESVASWYIWKSLDNAPKR